jgi:hypothetical protein
VNRYQHEMRRGVRFETAEANQVNGYGQSDLQTGNRGYPRTLANNSLAEDIIPGMQTVILTGGDQDYPTTIGISPWLV